MIPKRIFYCWFGPNEMSDLNKRCIESWKKFCPDYEIIKLSEENFDYNVHEYSRIGYEKGNWSYVSDIARIEALKNYGGFYLDTDVELFQSLDVVRDNNAIVHETGYGFYACGIMGCEKFPELYAKAYEKLAIGNAYYVLLNQFAYDMYNLTGDSYHKEADVTFYGTEYFGNSRSKITEKTIGVHWDENSWFNMWTGGFRPVNDFVPFAIHNPELNTEETMKWFGFIPEDKRLQVLKGVPIDINLMELGNYFYNPKVMRVARESFVFERLDIPKETKVKRLENGCFLEYCD